MSEASEPWNDSYVRDGDTECLLRRLEAGGVLTHDAIARACLRDEEIRALLDPIHSEHWQREMVSGLAEFVLSLGKSPAFSDAIRSSADEIDIQRRSLEWSLVPAHLHELARRRAGCILAFAQGEHLVEPDEAPASWRITDRGRSLLAAGGFYMR